jgi:tRNA1Val (adenine37-N6)-methyltransferase
MPNNYFRFKQFTVHQEKCAMKICTDACLFGSLLPASSKGRGVEHVLDIGTGTGLLSLMYAQKNGNAIIDAVEIDEAAAEQAKENFEASWWKERLHVHYGSIQQFAETINRKYDCIISNPPFYESDLKSEDAKRNLALHSAELKLEELIFIADNLLEDAGSFYVLLPYYRTEVFEKLIEGKFFIKEKVMVKQTPGHDYFRSMFWLNKQTTATNESEIIIMNDDGKYTTAFVDLLKDYYLYL